MQRPVHPRQIVLQETALDLLGKGSLRVQGRNFRLDCSGLVQAIYWEIGVDLTSPLSAYRGNGVARLHAYLSDLGLIYTGANPKVGDLIFWDNTYDRNNNGKADDYFTHIGMVVEIRENGDLQYIHHNYRKGIILERMNPRTPSLYTRREMGQNQVVNSPMRMRGSPDIGKTLSGELVRSWGSAWRIER